MYKKFYLKTMLLLAMLLIGAGNVWADDVTDVITAANLAATGTSYTAFSGVQITSDAVYAGKSALNNNVNIQLRSSGSDCGIVSTTSGGKLKSVKINVASGEKQIDVYGSNTAYTKAENLYNANLQGTKIGSVTSSGTITVSGDYAYVGIRSYNGAIYLSSVEIVWETGGSSVQTVATPSFSPAGGTYTSAQNVEISCATEGATIHYTTDGSTPSASSATYSSAIPVTETTTIKAIAVKEGMNNSDVATATYTISLPYSGDEYVRVSSLDYLTDGAQVIIAARYNSIATSYYAMTASATGKPAGVSFTSTTSSNGEIVPATILNSIDSEATYSWTVGRATTNDVTTYTFTNADNQALGYSSSTNFAINGDNTEWTISRSTAGNNAMVGGYEGFLITNKNNTGRGVALNNQYNYGPYATSNNNSSDYNFYVDLFVKAVSPANEPVITANDVEIAYDATSGSILYSITNEPTPAGTMAASSTSDWLTLGTVGENVPFTCDANSSAIARTATVTLTYTYNTNETVTKEVTVTQTGNPNVVMTIAEVRAQGTGDVTTKGVVTSCSGVTAYIQDATAAICVYGSELTVGDEIRVSGSLDTYNGLLEITNPEYTVLSQDNTVNPEVMTIAEVLASGNQGWLVRIENATVQSVGSNTVIAQGENTIIVRGIEDDVEIDDIISVTGNIGSFNNVQIVNPKDLLVQTPPTIRYYIAGSWDDNSWANGMVELTKNNDGKYTTQKAFDANTQFQVVKVDETNNNATTWYGGLTDNTDSNNPYGIHSGWYEDIPLTNSYGNNYVKNFKIEPSGTYTFTVDADNMTLTVTGWPVPVEKYYLAGSFATTQAWEDDMVELTENNDGTFSTTKAVDANTTFRFVKSVDGNLTWYGGNTNGNPGNYGVHKTHCTDIALTTDNAADFEIQTDKASETLTFTVDFNNTQFSVTGWSIEGDKFVKVTSTNDLANGRYLIVYEGANVALDGSRGDSNSNNPMDAVSNTVDVTISNNEIAATTETLAAIFYINVATGTIKSASGLYIGHTGSKNTLNTSETAYENSITISDNNAVIVCGGATLQFNATSGQTRFRYFTSAGQEAIQLYKFVPATIPAVTFSENDEDNSVIAANELLVVNATLTRTLSNSFWSTFSVPFDATAQQIEDALGTVELREFQGSEGTVIKFQEATAITAGHAYLVKPETTVTNPVFNGVTVVNTTGETDSDANGYGFVGTVIKKTLKTDRTELFLGTDAKFYYPESDAVATMKGLRGYFVVPAGTETSKLSVDVEGSGIATSINSMNIEGMGDGNIYNLNGQRVNAPQKGLYIVNGKKVIIK